MLEEGEKRKEKTGRDGIYLELNSHKLKVMVATSYYRVD